MSSWKALLLTSRDDTNVALPFPQFRTQRPVPVCFSLCENVVASGRIQESLSVMLSAIVTIPNRMCAFRPDDEIYMMVGVTDETQEGLPTWRAGELDSSWADPWKSIQAGTLLVCGRSSST